MFSTKSLRRLFQGETRKASRAPDGLVIYAVGDIHGRADLLGLVLEGVLADAADAAGDCMAIFMGDYVDRGPASREVIDTLIAFSAHPSIRSRFLCGNHDQSILDFLFDPASGPAWCDFGGRETLISYGVAPPRARTDAEAWAATARALAAALPESHLAFLRNLELSITLGDYFFAHAGARPGVPLEEQSERDLLWIREPFLGDPRRLAKVVVHGHTPTEAVHSDDRRIGVDTGAYATDVLTALRLEGSDRSLIQTRRRADRSHALAAVSLPDGARAVRG